MRPLVRAYIRWAPWRVGKRALWTRVAAGLAPGPHSVEVRSRYGFRIAGDPHLIMPRCMYWFGTWEPPLSDWIRRTLRPGDVFVDVGANIGWFTLLAARAVSPGGSVVAVEAAPDTADRLERNLAANRVRNVRLVRAAAAAEAGAVPFYRAPWNDAEHSTLPGKGREPAGEVAGLPLAELLTDAELRAARIVKVDVEGGELGVLLGLVPALPAMRDDVAIAVEAHPDMLPAQGTSLDGLLDLLRPAGFEARELPVDFSELAHLFPSHPDPAPLDPTGDGLRHLVLSRPPRGPRARERAG
jgi:FkbM family methyltransferase